MRLILFMFMLLALMLGRSSASRHGCSCRGWPVNQSGATINHFLQLVRVAGARHGSFQRNLLLEERRGQRLVESLHPKFFLTRLHGGINLVNLIFANEVADGSVG